VTAAPVLAANRLQRSFGDRVVVGPLDLEIAAGERVALVGPNGSGKSSLLRCVAGTLAPSAGSVHVVGAPAGSVAARRAIGASLAQERSFYLRLTGRANLELFASLRRSARAAKAEVAAVIDELEIGDIAAERVNRCSSGMVQQLALARALLGDTPLLLLDEPTRSLDAEAVERLWAALRRRAGTALLMATHRPEDVARCDRALDLGR